MTMFFATYLGWPTLDEFIGGYPIRTGLMPWSTTLEQACQILQDQTGHQVRVYDEDHNLALSADAVTTYCRALPKKPLVP